MWPDRVSNPGPLTYKSCALSTALRARQLSWTGYFCYQSCEIPCCGLNMSLVLISVSSVGYAL